MVLRAVDPAWLAAHSGELRSPKTRVEVSVRRSSCIEVAVSAGEARRAEFRLSESRKLTRGESVVHMGGETGFDPGSALEGALAAVWRVVVGSPVPAHFARDERNELREAIGFDSMIHRHYHLCVDLDDPKNPLSDSDLDDLQSELGELKLILIRVEGGSALLLDEKRLDRSILKFFQHVVEEKP